MKEHAVLTGISSVFQVVAESTKASIANIYQQCWKEWQVGVLKGVPNNAISTPKKA